MSGSEHPIEWYLARDGQQFGPLSDVELKKFVELGHLRASDLLWRQGLPDWRPASSVFPPPGQRTVPPSDAQPSPQQNVAQAPRGDVQRPVTEAKVNAAPAPAFDNPTTGNAAQRSEQAPARASRPQQPAGNGAQRPQRPAAGPHKAVASRPAMARRPVRGPAVHRRRFPLVSVTVCLLLAVVAGTALALHRSGRLSVLMADFGFGDATEVVATGSTDVTGSNASVPVKLASQDLGSSPLQGFGNSAAEIDAGFQKAALWRLLKKEFPSWYGDQVNQAAKLRAEQKDDKAIAQALAEGLVALRRKHVNDALSASPAKLRQLASSFLDNLGRLAGTSIEACYGFISQGETSPMVVELMRASEHAPHLQAQTLAVFEAIAEGRKSQRVNVPPRREDYDVLAAELAKRGWSPTDLQLFSDARALSRAAPQKVCQMVQDWFAAQLAVKDEEVQLRLLVEALKPVVAG